jgi:hypothetical protein
LRYVWEKDLAIRAKKNNKSDSEIDINELSIDIDLEGHAMEDFYG